MINVRRTDCDVAYIRRELLHKTLFEAQTSIQSFPRTTSSSQRESTRASTTVVKAPVDVAAVMERGTSAPDIWERCFRLRAKGTDMRVGYASDE